MSTSPIMRYFDSAHLPPKLQAVAAPIESLAVSIDQSLPDGAEKSAGLRKLLEAKDCFVRAALPLACLLLLILFSGCVTPELAVVEGGSSGGMFSGFTDRVTEHAVDYAKTKYADPLAQDIAAAVSKNFGGDLADFQAKQELAEEMRKAGGEAPVNDQPGDILHVVVCDLSADGIEQRCHAPQLVPRSQWPHFWEANRGSWKYPNGNPAVKFTVTKIERSILRNPPANGPPIVVSKETAFQAPSVRTYKSAPTGCTCPNCNCSFTVTVPLSTSPYRGERVVYRCRTCR